jgi:hypothetical protein
MNNRIPFIVTACALAFCASFAGPIKDNSLTATSDGNAILVRWLSEDETGVLRYELERKAGLGGQFFLLTTKDVQGNNSTYEYVDDSAFRVTESLYQYRVKVILNGTSVYFGPITVSHKTSDVKRTWGSIKAMFR